MGLLLTNSGYHNACFLHITQSSFSCECVSFYSFFLAPNRYLINIRYMNYQHMKRCGSIIKREEEESCGVIPHFVEFLKSPTLIQFEAH